MFMCGGLSHSKSATAFIVIVFEEMIFQSKNPLVHFSSYLRSASLSNKSFFFFSEIRHFAFICGRNPPLQK